MLWLTAFLAYFVSSAAAARLGFDEYEGDELLIKDLLDPFWIDFMVPVAICLVVLLLLLSIFGVALITVRSIQEDAAENATFTPAGFDYNWYKNMHSKPEAERLPGQGSTSPQVVNVSAEETERKWTNSPVEFVTHLNLQKPKMSTSQIFLPEGSPPKPLPAANTVRKNDSAVPV